ncbi:MAG TPA: SDR family oxidoreductase [Elusimicrobiota bacterium]|jgi:dTDP-4-dehydrorhamnose reductase|nr:SDR family oxidoreductase [Elusimicrobiota bacterium]
MRALIVGASGLLGYAALRAWRGRPGWSAAGTGRRMVLPGLHPLDILDAGAVDAVLERTAPEAVLVAAANPHVDYCETHPEDSRRVNVEATAALIRKAAARGARVVFASTDYVFDGARGRYAESDAPRPGCEYARQKLEMEKVMEGLGPAGLVVRLSGLFGWELRGRNFVVRVLKELSLGNEVRAADDQEYNPTYADDVAVAIAELLERRSSGLFHLAGEETVTRCELVRRAARTFGLDASRVVPVKLDDVNRGSPVKRPRRTSLDVSKATRELGRAPLGATKALARMLETRAAWNEEAHRALGRALEA